MTGLFAWLNPGRWLLMLALAGALMLGYFAWANHQQEIGYQKRVGENNAQTIKDVAAASKRTAELQAKTDKAVQDAKTRETKILADAGRARAESDRLRSDITTIRASLPGLAHDAIVRYADTASDVFEQCSRRYLDLAQSADGLASERQTLEQAWPQ